MKNEHQSNRDTIAFVALTVSAEPCFFRDCSSRALQLSTAEGGENTRNSAPTEHAVHPAFQSIYKGGAIVTESTNPLHKKKTLSAHII